MLIIQNKVARIAFNTAKETYIYGVRNAVESLTELARHYMTEIIYHNGRNSKESRLDKPHKERT